MIKGILGFLKSLIFGESGNQASSQTVQSLKERTIQAVELEQPDAIHKGPRGGLYRLDAKGRKIYLKQSSSTTGKPRRARRRRQPMSKAS